MRHPLFISMLAGAMALGCAQENIGTPPPAPGQPFAGFYFPTGIAFVPDASGGPGFVYVVSSDFDLRYNRGTLAAVDLATLADAIPATAGATPAVIADPHIAAQVSIDVLGGPVAVYQAAGRPPNERRIFIAGRQNNSLDAVDVDGQAVRCALDASTDDCSASAASLGSGMVDAYRPLVVGNQVFVGGLTAQDHPATSGMQSVSSVARLNADNLSDLSVRALGPPDSQVGAEAVDGLAVVGNQLYLGGRATGGVDENGGALYFNDSPLRMLSLDGFTTAGSATYVPLDAQVLIRDARAMALSSDGTRLYLVTHSPDGLAILDVSPGLDGSPRNTVVGVADLPLGATELAVIPRGPGRRDVVAVTCGTANVLALYDDEIGRVVAAVRGLGEQPFGVAVGPRLSASGAVLSGVRLYTTAFGRGDLAVVELPNLDDASTAAVLATLGPNENCLNDTVDARPPECPNK